MAKHILGIGGLFFVILLVILVFMQHSDVDSVTDILAWRWDEYNGLNDYEKSLFFTIFVMLQFWNMFNAKAFLTGRSAFHDLRADRGFLLVGVLILVGQFFIVSLGGQMFQVCPLAAADWGILLAATSVILWAGELKRRFWK